MTVEWSEGAYQDYDEILEYLVREFGMRVAREFQKKLDERVNMLSNNPFAGHSEYYNPKTNIEYRSFSCRQYQIVYAPMGDRLIIITLWNNRRNPAMLRLLLSRE